MKILPLVSICALAILCACVPSPSQPAAPDYNAKAEYLANVSTMYSIGAVPTDGRFVNVQYKDSNGYVRSFTADSGKVLLITFWRTTIPESVQEIAGLDSIARIMGDSVKVFGIATDNTIHSFATVSSSVGTNKNKLQVIVDSTLTATRLYTELSGETSFYYPETFIIKPSTMVSDILQGYFPADSLLARARKAWK